MKVVTWNEIELHRHEVKQFLNDKNFEPGCIVVLPHADPLDPRVTIFYVEKTELVA